MSNGSGNYSFFNHKLRMPDKIKMERTRTSPLQQNKLLERRSSSENALHRLESLSIMSPTTTTTEEVIPFRSNGVVSGFIPHPPESPKTSDEAEGQSTTQRSSALRFLRGKKRNRNESPRTSGSEDEKQCRKFAFTSKVSPLSSPRRSSTGSLGSTESLGSASEVELLRRRNMRGLEPLKGIRSDKDLVSSFKNYQQNARSGSPNDSISKSSPNNQNTPVKVIPDNGKNLESLQESTGICEPSESVQTTECVSVDTVGENGVAAKDDKEVTSSLSSDDSFTNVSCNDDDVDDDDSFSSSSNEDLKKISENIANELLSSKRYLDATLPSLPKDMTGASDSGKYENIGSGTYENCASALYQNAKSDVQETHQKSKSREYENINGTVSTVGETTAAMYETLSGYQNQRIAPAAQSNSTGELNKLDKKSSHINDSKYNSDSELSMTTGSEFSNMSRSSLLPRVPANRVRMRNNNFLREEMERYFPDHKVGVFVATWNMHEEKDVPGYLDDFLLPESVDFLQDVYVIGLQESTSSRNEWEIRLQETLGPSHVLMYCCNFGVLHLAVFVRRELVWFCSAVRQDSIATRPGHLIKTKGGLAVTFSLFGTSFLFINSHLTSDEGRAKDRVNDYNKIRKTLSLQAEEKPWVDNSPDVTDRFDRIFWLGDFNFRVDMERKNVDKLIAAYQEQENPDYKELLEKDQLSCLMSQGEVFHGFSEPSIRFQPTYKLDLQSDDYDTSSKMRTPSWTDRILYKSRMENTITAACYSACTSVKTSDHRPVYGIYEVTLKPCKESVHLTGGQFVRDVYIEAYRRRSTAGHKSQQESTVCTIL